MSYLEAFEQIRRAAEGLTAGVVTGHLAIQIDLTDSDAAGICYLEASDGVFHAEPYDYRDRDARIYVRSADLVAVLTGEKDYAAAVADGTLTVEGAAARARELVAAIPVKKPKSAPRKPAGEKKPAAKRTRTAKSAKATD